MRHRVLVALSLFLTVLLVLPAICAQGAFASQTITDSETAYTYSALGYRYYGQGKYAEALEEYRRAMELDPDQEAYADWVAVLLHQYSEQIKMPDSDLAYAYSALGYWYYGQDRHAEALVEYRHAMELAPDQEAYADWVAILLHRYSEQIKMPDSDLAYTYSALGYWYHGQGKYAEALVEYRRAMELAPDRKVYADWVKTLEKK